MSDSADLRDLAAERDPELHARVRTIPEAERRREASARLGRSLNRRQPPVGEHERLARIMVKGLAGALLRHGVAVWLVSDLTHCWNIVALVEPLPNSEVDRLIDDAIRQYATRSEAA